MLLIDIRSTNASAAEFILYRLKLYLAGRHHHTLAEEAGGAGGHPENAKTMTHRHDGRHRPTAPRLHPHIPPQTANSYMYFCSQIQSISAPLFVLQLQWPAENEHAQHIQFFRPPLRRRRPPPQLQLRPCRGLCHTSQTWWCCRWRSWTFLIKLQNKR